MTHYISSIVVFALLCSLCACSQSPRTDEQYLADWRKAEAEQDLSHTGGDWHFDFQTVRLYRINWDDQYTMRHRVTGDKLNETREPTDGILLTEAQVEQLQSAVTGTHTDVGIGLCIYPHHAFVFYGVDGEIVGSIDVCFLCGSFHAEPNGYAKNWDLLSVAKLIHDTGVPIRNPGWE